MRRAAFAAAALSTTAAFAVAVPIASAANVANLFIPLSGQAVNSCNGELVTFSGPVHVVVDVTSDGAGGFHMVVSQNVVNWTGSGDQGNNYVLPQTSHTSRYESDVKAGSTTTGTLSQLAISKGSAPNFELFALSHVTVNANGEVSSSIDTFSADCRG
jgi:hypothetical protein